GGGAAADEGRDRGDHGGEPGAKKRALGLEDYGQLPPELRKRVHEEVEQARQRSGWPAQKTLAAVGRARGRDYRWLREGGGGRAPCQRSRASRCSPTRRYRKRKKRCWITPANIRNCGTGRWRGGWWTRTWCM